MSQNSLSPSELNRTDRAGPFRRLVWFLRRRGREVGFAALAFLALTLTAHAFPRRWVADAMVVPPGVAPYPGPVERLVSTALSPHQLAEAASIANVPTAASVFELLDGSSSLQARLGASMEVRRDERGALHGIAVRAEAASRDQARRLVEALAAGLISANAQLVVSGAPAPAGGSNARHALDASRRRLSTLRERHPGLADPEKEGRVRALERAAGDERVELAAWEARASAASETVARLSEAVQREAELAWRAAEAEARRQVAPPPRPVEPTPAPALQRAPSRLEELEAELIRQLASRTDRHPEVRRLLRLIEAERASEERARESAPPSRPVSDGPRGGQIATEEADPSDATFIAEDDPLGAAPAAGPPPVFLTRAPSYGSWVSAQAEEARANREVEARRRSLEARQGEQSRLQAELDALGRVRHEEQTLVREVAELERTASAAPAEGVPALVLAAPEPTLTPLTWAPWSLGQALLLAVGIGLLAGLGKDLFDRSYHQADELSELPVPVLGVVPHLRK